MNAERYLKRIAVLDRRIQNRMQSAERWRTAAKSCTTNFGNERVQSSGSKQQMENALINALSLEELILKDSQELREIEDTLNALSIRDLDSYDVIYKIYILQKSYKQIADEKGKSVSWVKNKRKSGLGLLDEILKERDEYV